MRESAVGLLTRPSISLPGAADLGPKEPPLLGLPTHRANLVIVTTPVPSSEVSRAHGNTHLLVPSTIPSPPQEQSLLSKLAQNESEARILYFFSSGVARRLDPAGFRDTEKETKKEKSPLEATILRNFYLSFKYSQQDRDLQRILFEAINSQYDSAEIRKEFGTIVGLNNRMRHRISNLRIPKNHVEIGNPQAEFERQWVVQSDILQSHFLNENELDQGNTVERVTQEPSDKQKINILSRLVTRDDEFFETGRQETESERDLFESQVKEYIIDRKPTGSVQFDVLFNYLQEVALRALVYDPGKDDGKIDLEFSTLGVKLRNIRKAWEDSHTGEKFSTIEAPKPAYYLYNDESPDTEVSDELWREFDGLSGTNVSDNLQ